jgi:hypothetical protein
MSEKWHVVKVLEENREKYFVPDNYVVFSCNDVSNQVIKDLGDTIVLTTPSKEIAESTKKALNERL